MLGVFISFGNAVVAGEVRCAQSLYLFSNFCTFLIQELDPWRPPWSFLVALRCISVICHSSSIYFILFHFYLRNLLSWRAKVLFSLNMWRYLIFEQLLCVISISHSFPCASGAWHLKCLFWDVWGVAANDCPELWVVEVCGLNIAQEWASF